nr:FAD-dependent oxidoreductase [Candidatus Njordarchaeota archaeon]
MAEEKFDAIIVGAGPGGSATAYSLAKAGLNVLLVERGRQAGSKNMSGAMLYTYALNKLIPRFWEDSEFPMERLVTRYVLSFLSNDSWTSVDFKTKRSSEPPYNGITLLRAKFDKWLADKAESVGANVAEGVRVDDLLWDNRKVVGVRAGTEELHANVVVAADGVNSPISRKSKIRGDFPPENVALGIKEIIQLPQNEIEKRFNLNGNEGAAYISIGGIKRVVGGGFLYTNRDTVSLGIVTNVKSLADIRVKSHDLIEMYRTHPAIYELIKDGKIVEYAAHLVPKGAVVESSHLYKDGLLVVGSAAGLMLSTAFTTRGMDLAILSGMAAAQTIIAAKKQKNFSAKTLSGYAKRLNSVLQELKAFRKVEHLLYGSRFHSIYPDLICNLMQQQFSVSEKGQVKLIPSLLRVTKGKMTMLGLVRDLVSLFRALI